MSTKHNKQILLGLGLLLVIAALACQVSIPSNENTQVGQPRQFPTRTARVQANPTQPDIPLGPTPTLVPIPPAVIDEQSLLVNLYNRVNPAVVNITDYGTTQGQLVPVSQGSGFVYDTNGRIVTNAHVVIDAEQVEVTFADGAVRQAEVLGQDLHADLAVIQVESLPEGVTPLPLGTMDELAVGQTVVAIGNPFGLEGTLTRGVISALGRSIPSLTGFTIPQAIQTDASINPGNSGGPLLNLNGQVVGVNAQIETGGEGRSNVGIGFAIPVTILNRVVPDLIEQGKHAWAYLGVQGGNLSSFQIEAMNLPVDKGAYISRVLDGEPADEAGLRGSSNQAQVDGRTVEVGGDVVTAVNGEPVGSFEDMLIYIALSTQPGDTVTLTILRDGDQMDVDVVLGERPQNVDTGFTLPLGPDATLPPDHP